MAMSYVWAVLVIASLVFGIAGGRVADVGAAALEGAQKAVTLSVSLAGALCLWNGVVEVLRVTGADRGLARLMRPVLGRLFKKYRQNSEVQGAIAANVTANLLGLGNAATPLGIRAASLMGTKSGVATDEQIRFMVMNTSSLQLVPATIAALRGGLGAASPFDILPAVWVASAVSLAVALVLCYTFKRFT